VKRDPRPLRIATRELAEHVWRRGDLHARYDEGTLPDEGVAAQRRCQQQREPGYQREVPVAKAWTDGVVELEVSGRADGCCLTAAPPYVEEFKATRHDPAALYVHLGTVHLAQVRLYAAMLAHVHPNVPDWEVRLVYVHPDTFARHEVSEHASRVELEHFFELTCRRLAERVARLRQHRSGRDADLSALAFPFERFRAPQHTLARNVYRALRDGSALAVCAPTGTGKTMGTLYPALKCVGAGHLDRVVFLTARGTGQCAAEEASARLARQAQLRVTTITAKERICLMERPVCDPDVCPYARGHYDRVAGATDELLQGRIMTRDQIVAVAREHTVCPFELSLEAAVASDVVIADYNYAFDPVVRLQRIHGLFDDRTAVLVDEAHHLADRARRALSCTLSRRMLRDAIGHLVTETLERARAGLEQQLLALRRGLGRKRGAREPFEAVLDEPKALLRAAARFFDAWTEAGPIMRDAAPPAMDLLFAVLRLQRAVTWQDAEHFAWVLKGQGRMLELELECLDPSSHIGHVLDTFAGHVRFSGTLEPLPLFQRLHGVDGPISRVASPFPAENLATYVVTDVSVLFRDRDRCLDALVGLIADVVNARQGNYLVALPSFDYLGRVAERFAVSCPDKGQIRQRRDMDATAREAFVAALMDPHGVNVAFVVMGGVFAESIDLPGDALIGVIVVGVGLPPPQGSLERIATRFGDDGPSVAYRQPAMTRVVQAAGRLIRTETDRGVLCLVDARFRHSEFRRFLPPHWRPEPVRAAELADRLDAFWNSV